VLRDRSNRRIYLPYNGYCAVVIAWMKTSSRLTLREGPPPNEFLLELFSAAERSVLRAYNLPIRYKISKINKIRPTPPVG
jgi:hypothetical protein